MQCKSAIESCSILLSRDLSSHTALLLHSTAKRKTWLVRCIAWSWWYLVSNNYDVKLRHRPNRDEKMVSFVSVDVDVVL